MRTVEFRRLLDAENALRIRFELEHGKVLTFVVQLECLFDYNWFPVMRYDTAHNFVHCDQLHPYKATVKTTLSVQDYNEALTFVIQDLSKRWNEYRRRYETWLTER